MDGISRKALIYLHFFALLTYGRRRTSVNFGFIFANLCKHFTQKWSVLHFGTDHLQKLLFSPGVFFDYSDAIFDSSNTKNFENPQQETQKCPIGDINLYSCQEVSYDILQMNRIEFSFDSCIIFNNYLVSHIPLHNS